jgi:transposase
MRTSVRPVDRDRLAAYLAEGLSLEQIGALVGRHPSTVGYWLKKHGLRAVNSERFAARGAPARRELERLAGAGASLREMAEAIERSVATVRYWLRRWEIDHARPRRVDPATAPPIVLRPCRTHGATRFRLEGRGYYRCMRCRQERVSQRRRRLKLQLVTEAGGACRICGYDRCVAALEFHHIDPATKQFALSAEGVTRSIRTARAEAAKCVLLCATCHAEVEAGFRRLDGNASPTPNEKKAPRGGLEPP